MQYSAHYRYPQSFPQSAAAVIACTHYQSPIVKYGTVERSDLAKCVYTHVDKMSSAAGLSYDTALES